MPRICYQEKNFKPATLERIEQANAIIDSYAAQGFDLTLRQLYYRFVAQAFISNTQREYKKLGSIINDARIAGLIDWDAIVDRTRHIRSLDNWTNAADIVDDAVRWYQLDKWANQETRVEVWIEKDALVGVIEGVCQRNDVSFFSCRGYTSQSAMWRAAQRINGYIDSGQTVRIIHLGDHDPSGIDMTRDIEDRLDLFLTNDGHYRSSDWDVDRIALNMDQIRAYSPPPNPTKTTDARAAGYIRRFGHESWELDALEPPVLIALVEYAIRDLRDDEAWEERCTEEEEGRERLREVHRVLRMGPGEYFQKLKETLSDGDDDE